MITETYNVLSEKKGTDKTLHVQKFNTSEKYICGDYDLEVLCLPRMILEDVNIAQSKTTTVQIPNPGIATIKMQSPSYGSLYVEKKIMYSHGFII
ncbi:MAG: hypothetical protein IPJ79_11630 [Bacteroidetes bacterium]|nr:hypothetical protein [Bacteroidota bacterium]